MIERDTLTNLLRQNDPAGNINAVDCAALESRVMQRLAQPDLSQRVSRVMEQILPAFQLGRWHVPWPVVSASAMVCGLALGVMIASVVEAPPTTSAVHSYVLTEAIPQPWENY